MIGAVIGSYQIERVLGLRTDPLANLAGIGVDACSSRAEHEAASHDRLAVRSHYRCRGRSGYRFTSHERSDRSGRTAEDYRRCWTGAVPTSQNAVNQKSNFGE